MPKFLVTLATYETDNPCTAEVEIEAVNPQRAELAAKKELGFTYESLEWTDTLGNVVDWEDVDGLITVAEGTEPI